MKSNAVPLNVRDTAFWYGIGVIDGGLFAAAALGAGRLFFRLGITGLPCMRIGAHRAKEPQILGKSGEIAFKRPLHLEIIRLSRGVADFAGQLRDLFHIGLNDSDGFAAGEDSRGQFFNHRSLKRFGDRSNRHFAAHLQNFCCFVILLSSTVIKRFRVFMDPLEEMTFHIPMNVVQLHIPNGQRGDVSIDFFGFHHVKFLSLAIAKSMAICFIYC